MIEGKDLIQFGTDEAGRRAVQFSVDRTELGKTEAPISVIVRPMLAGDNERALTIARFLCDYKNAMDAMRQQVETGDRTIVALEEVLEKTKARCSELRHKLEVACGLGLGRARGTFYAREDRGKVWLHYDKDPGGFALCFSGWSDLANSRPELRPVGVGFEVGVYVEMAEVALAQATTPEGV